MTLTHDHSAAPAHMGGTLRAGALARARRHSALVRKLRFALPALAAALVVVALLPTAEMLTAYGPVKVERISMEDGALKIEKPRLSGYTSSHQAYEVSAVSARQDIAKPHLVRLTGITAEIEEEEGRMTRVEAPEGIFNTREETLSLAKDIVVRWAAGHQMRLKAVRINMKNGNVVSEKPVRIDLLNGTVRADSMRIINKGERLIFSGNVALDFRPDGKQEKAGGEQ